MDIFSDSDYTLDNVVNMVADYLFFFHKNKLIYYFFDAKCTWRQKS